MNYQAKRAENGQLTIFRVPIFVECKRGENEFDAEWLAQAVERAKQAEREGYFAPLHVRHHDGTNQVQAAGYFRITGTGTLTFKGSRRMAIYADLVITDQFIGEEILSDRLPYRSVEIFNVDSPAIDSLALLDHEAPYLELPMLMVADVEGQTSEKAFANANFANPWLNAEAFERGPLVACFSRGHSAHLIFQDEPEDMTTTKTLPKTQPKTDADSATNAEQVNMEAGEGKGEEKEGKGDEMEAGMDVGAVVKAIKNGSISVADMDSIMAAIQEMQSGAESTATDEDKPAPAAAPGESMTKNTETAKQFARLEGENMALKARLDARDAEDKRRADVSAAMVRLQGRPLGADIEGKLVAFHKKHGAEPFAEHVDAMANTFATLGDDDDRMARFASQQESGQPEIADRWVKQGSDAVKAATVFAREWEANRSAGIRVPLDRYVEISMQRAGFKAPAKAAK